MRKEYKKYAAAVLLLMAAVGGASAVYGQTKARLGSAGMQIRSDFFVITANGNGLIPLSSRDLGSNAERVPNIFGTNIYATNLYATTTSFTRSGGALDMGGYDISNGGTFTFTNFVATSTTATSTVFTVASDSGDLTIHSAGTTNDLRLNPYGGNVGIGDTSPDFPFEIENATASMQLNSTTGTNVAYVNFENDSVGGVFRVGAEGSAGAQMMAGTSAYAGVVNVQGAYPLQFGTSNTVQMTILSTGNVGIGTTSPWGLLSVEQGTETNSLVVSNTGSSTPSFVVQGVNGDGKIGIASTSPWRTLGITGTVGLSSSITDASGTPGSLCYDTTTFQMTKNNALNCTVSDRNQKNSIEKLSVSALDLIDQMQPTQFKYNDSDRLRWGFIAQDLQAIDPRLGDNYVINKKGELEAHSIDLPAIDALQTKAIQELREENRELRARMEELEQKAGY